MKPLLTIAIPTFNRADKLNRALQILLEQIAGKNVELLVSDNASEDATQAMMTELCAAHPEISYVRNPENVGPDRNFLNCYNRANGEYVLLLGDDDIFLPGAIDAIMEALARKPVFVYLNTCGIRNQEPLELTPPINPEGEMVTFRDRNEMMEAMGIYVTFMSSFILRSDLVQAIEDKERFIGTYFIQSHIALLTLAEEGEYLFLKKNCLAASGNTTVNYDVYFVWGRMYGQLLHQTAVAAGMDANRVQKQHEKDLRGLIAIFVKNFRQTCSNSGIWEKEAMLEQVRPYPGQYLRYLGLMYLPLSAVRCIGKLKALLKK